jgi:SUMO ligase MMS21 Smc5/6 complex component
MTELLFYSTKCNFCAKMLIELRNLKKIYYVCVDNTVTINNKKYAVLSNGNHILIIPEITSIPSLLIVQDENSPINIIKGNDIISHLKKSEELPPTIMEYDAAHMNKRNTNCGIFSDTYSFLDMSTEDQKALGDGGVRQMYNYATIEGNFKIETPEETYVTNTASDTEYEEFKRIRDSDISSSIPKRII